jgi:hypothetical protein
MATMRRLLLCLGVLISAGFALGGCVVATDYPPGYYRPYGYGYRSYGPPPGRYYDDWPGPGYRYRHRYDRRPYWW